MARNVTLIDSSTQEQIYPTTLVGNVLSPDGSSLGSLVETAVTQSNTTAAALAEVRTQSNTNADAITEIRAQIPQIPGLATPSTGGVGGTNGLMSAQDKEKVGNVMNLVNSNTTSGSLTLSPNTLYSLGALTGALTVTLGTPVSGIPNTYTIEFDVNDSASTPTKVPNFPSVVVWNNEVTWTTGKHYEVSIRYSANAQAYYGVIAEFDTES